ncbi:SCP2 sterol-binding domain-containing protein [Myxococcota bacterium]|nr:SCP2 sterol-binding domain-containing protein [Myxococcota bacterium]
MSDLTPKSIFEERIALRLKTSPERVKGINASFQFNITGDGGGQWAILLDGNGGEVHTGAVESPGCTITMKDEDFVNMIKGGLNAQMAFMTGRLKVVGDMALALRLQQVIG